MEYDSNHQHFLCLGVHLKYLEGKNTQKRLMCIAMAFFCMKLQHGGLYSRYVLAFPPPQKQLFSLHFLNFKKEIGFWYKIEDMVKSGERPEIPKGCCAPEFENLIKLCWQDAPSGRPSFDDIITKLLVLTNVILSKRAT